MESDPATEIAGMSEPLESYSLYVPQIPSEPWSEELKQAEGANRLFLLQQTRLVSLLKGVPERSAATPARVAWLAMWVKVLRTVDAARSCCERGNDFAMRILGRTLFELGLHLSAVLRPVLQWVDLEASGMKVSKPAEGHPEAWALALRRLSAYTAWCLNGDLGLVEFLLRPGTQRELWDPSPTRELTRDPKRLAIHERLFGPVEILNPHELAHEKKLWVEGLKGRQKRLQGWLTHPDLTAWVAKLSTRRTNGPMTLFELLDETEPSLRQFLKQRRLLFAYFQYLRGSLLIHGSTVDEVLFAANEVIVPTIMENDDEVLVNVAGELGPHATYVSASLHLLCPHLWPSSDSGADSS
jgi:hypothetical protein